MVLRFSTWCLLVGILGGCSQGPGPSSDPASASSDESLVPLGVEAQIDEGADWFSAACSECHGSDGEGGAGVPRLIGDDALMTFDTARDVYDFASALMPASAPGSLSEEQYLAILAFLLSENGIELEESLTREHAESVSLH